MAKQKEKDKPRSAGRHGTKYKAYFARDTWFWTKLRRILRSNGETAAREWTSTHGADLILRKILEEKGATGKSPRVQQPTRPLTKPMATTQAPNTPKGTFGDQLVLALGVTREQVEKQVVESTGNATTSISKSKSQAKTVPAAKAKTARPKRSKTAKPEEILSQFWGAV